MDECSVLTLSGRLTTEKQQLVDVRDLTILAGLLTSQLISLFVAAGAIVFLILRLRRKNTL